MLRRHLIAIGVFMGTAVSVRAGVKAASVCSLPEVQRPTVCRSSKPSVFLKGLWELMEGYESCVLSDDMYPELYDAVETYWAARVDKRTDAIAKLLPEEMESEQRNEEMKLERETIENEEILAYTICALRTYEEKSSVLHVVFVRVLAIVDGRCLDDVVTTAWVLTQSGWRLRRSEPERWRPMAIP